MSDWYSNKRLKYIAVRFACAAAVVYSTVWLLSAEKEVWVPVSILLLLQLLFSLLDWKRLHRIQPTEGEQDRLAGRAEN